jgi:AraC-like DNA-binding protein
MTDIPLNLLPFSKMGECATRSASYKKWNSIESTCMRRTGVRKEEAQLYSDHHIVVLNLNGVCERGQYFFEGAPASFHPRGPGAVMFIPAGRRLSGWETGGSSAAYLSVSVDPVTISGLVEDPNHAVSNTLQPELSCEDAIIANAAAGVGREMSESGSLSHLIVQSYVMTIFLQIIRRQSVTYRAIRVGGLSPQKLKTVLERIEEDLSFDLSLQGLAEMADLSVPHFCRAFKQSMGSSPYAFIVRRRIDRAKQFLRHSSMSVTEIALACGFGSSSHFANIFRREVGISPVAYRSLL